MVDLDRRLELVAVFQVVHHDVAGEQLGHAGRIELDVEFLELDPERQFLHQHAGRLVQDRGMAGLALGDRGIAAKAGIAGAQAMLGRDLGDHAAAGERRLAKEPLLDTHGEFRIQHAAQQDHDDRGVGEDIAELVAGALLGRDQDGAFLLDEFGGIAGVAQAQRALLGQRGARQRRLPVGLVVEIAQRFHTHVLAPAAHIAQHLRRVAHHAQRGRDDQHHQDDQEPPARIDVVQAELVEDLEPERPELVHVIGHRLVLLEHGANDGGDGDDGEQADREAHRGDQLNRLGQPGAAGIQFNSGGAHTLQLSSCAKADPRVEKRASARRCRPLPFISCSCVALKRHF